MNIKINVINEMRRLRSNTYSDRYTWVDEIIQNCQRAKATTVKVDVTDNKVTISDNGIGCSNPEMLFEKNISGWSSDVMSTENPFGEGFFSTIVVANTVIIESVGFKAVFDVNKMFEENTVDAVTITPNARKSGFRITLTDFLPNVYTFEIENKFKTVAKYIKNPRIILNGSTIKFEGTSPKKDYPYLHKINNEYFTGWIRPTSYDNYDYWYKIKYFAFDRHIKEEELGGITGIINLKPNVVNFRAPDRKDFIYDEDYNSMKSALNKEIIKCFKKIVKNGSDKDIKTYEMGIDQNLNIDDYENYIKFKFYNNDEVEVVEDEENETTNNTFDNINETNIEVTNNDIITTANIVSKINNIYEEVDKCEQTGEKLNRDNNFGFYVEEEEVSKFADYVAITGYYNIPLVLIRNKLEKNVIETKNNFKHISELHNSIKLEAKFKNNNVNNEAEKRILKILNRITDTLFGKTNVFIISDTEFSNVIEFDNKNYKMCDINSFATAYENRIFLNRKYIKNRNNLTEDSDRLNQEDIKFIMLNLETICHEMSHCFYYTVDNTKEHFESIIRLMQKVIELVYN